MYGIELLVDEHKKIIRFTEVLRKACCNIIEGKEADTALLREGVAFGRNYADKQHHGKEEQILFALMLDKLGALAEKLIRNGMLVEHDLGRLHMSELEAALDRYEENPDTAAKLDIITHASGYAELLKRHIGKEDAVVYTFAERMLSDGDKKDVDIRTGEFEKEASERGVQEKYLAWLNEAEKRV